MEDICRQIEEHLPSLQSLVNEVKDIGYATLVSNRRIPVTSYNQAYRVNVTESETQKLIGEVAGYYKSMGSIPAL